VKPRFEPKQFDTPSPVAKSFGDTELPFFAGLSARVADRTASREIR